MIEAVVERLAVVLRVAGLINRRSKYLYSLQVFFPSVVASVSLNVSKGHNGTNA